MYSILISNFEDCFCFPKIYFLVCFPLAAPAEPYRLPYEYELGCAVGEAPPMEALVEYVVTQRQRPHIRDAWRTGVARSRTGTEAGSSAAGGLRTSAVGMAATSVAAAVRLPSQPMPIPQTQPQECRQAPQGQTSASAQIPVPPENSESGRIAIDNMNNLSLNSPRHQPATARETAPNANSSPRATASTSAGAPGVHTGTLGEVVLGSSGGVEGGSGIGSGPPPPSVQLSDVFGTLIATIEECWDAESEARLSASCVEDRLARLERALLAAMPLPELSKSQSSHNSSDAVSAYEL